MYRLQPLKVCAGLAGDGRRTAHNRRRTLTVGCFQRATLPYATAKTKQCFVTNGCCLFSISAGFKRINIYITKVLLAQGSRTFITIEGCVCNHVLQMIMEGYLHAKLCYGRRTACNFNVIYTQIGQIVLQRLQLQLCRASMKYKTYNSSCSTQLCSVFTHTVNFIDGEKSSVDFCLSNRADGSHESRLRAREMFFFYKKKAQYFP